MVVTKKKPNKGIITEKIISNLMSRYAPHTLITLLIEVNQVADLKINWNELVSKTSTGISNAREYQMLWRHLAYQDPILETIEDGAEPLDDDSDLEFELEAYPPVSREAAAEAAACMKVLIATGWQGDSSMTMKAPLTLNIPNYQFDGEASENEQQKSTNITIPIYVNKQNQSIPLTEALDINGPSSYGGTKKRRKTWTPEEDKELIAAVVKCGEGNWASIIKGDFKGERTASQLSQRWAILKKRKGVLNKIVGAPQVSEAHLQATHKAVSLALNMPVLDRLKASASSNNVAGMSNAPSCQQDRGQATSSKSPFGPNDQLKAAACQQDRVQATSSKSPFGPNDQLKAAAVAAGARIASSQGKAAVIVPGLGLPPNYHFMRTGPVTVPVASGVQQRPQPQSSYQKPAPSPNQINEEEEDDSIFDIFKTEASLARKRESNHQVIEQRHDQPVSLINQHMRRIEDGRLEVGRKNVKEEP